LSKYTQTEISLFLRLNSALCCSELGPRNSHPSIRIPYAAALADLGQDGSSDKGGTRATSAGERETPNRGAEHQSGTHALPGEGPSAGI